jgi:hypothetical protein
MKKIRALETKRQFIINTYIVGIDPGKNNHHAVIINNHGMWQQCQNCQDAPNDVALFTSIYATSPETPAVMYKKLQLSLRDRVRAV